jgi:hypothetical protein
MAHVVLTLVLVVATRWFDASRMSPVLPSSGAVSVVLHRSLAPVTVTLTDEDSQRCQKSALPAQLVCPTTQSSLPRRCRCPLFTGTWPAP